MWAAKVAAGYRPPGQEGWPEPLRRLVSDCWDQDQVGDLRSAGVSAVGAHSTTAGLRVHPGAAMAVSTASEGLHMASPAVAERPSPRLPFLLCCCTLAEQAARYGRSRHTPAGHDQGRRARATHGRSQGSQCVVPVRHLLKGAAVQGPKAAAAAVAQQKFVK
jgi:hypothetical protein